MTFKICLSSLVWQHVDLNDVFFKNRFNSALVQNIFQSWFVFMMLFELKQYFQTFEMSCRKVLVGILRFFFAYFCILCCQFYCSCVQFLCITSCFSVWRYFSTINQLRSFTPVSSPISRSSSHFLPPQPLCPISFHSLFSLTLCFRTCPVSPHVPLFLLISTCKFWLFKLNL